MKIDTNTNNALVSKSMVSNNQAKLIFILIALITLALSQLSGYLVNTHLSIGESYELSSFFHLTHIRNYGGIFGSFHGKGTIVAGFSIVLLAGLCVYLFVKKDIKLYEYICFGFIVGAGASNVAGRFIYGSVIDYINIQGIPYWNYVFNTADTFIHIGVWPMILFTVLEARSEKSEATK